jgi:hypothetical protein
MYASTGFYTRVKAAGRAKKIVERIINPNNKK